MVRFIFWQTVASYYDSPSAGPVATIIDIAVESITTEAL